jgi:hypothetical protein
MLTDGGLAVAQGRLREKGERARHIFPVPSSFLQYRFFALDGRRLHLALMLVRFALLVFKKTFQLSHVIHRSSGSVFTDALFTLGQRSCWGHALP